MLQTDLSKSILTIGCEYKHPKGGVAQVLFNYEQFIFPNFKCITNSGGTRKSYKLIKAISGLVQLVCRLSCDRKIRIVHIHTASYNSFKRSSWFVKIAKLYRKKVILHIHGGGFDLFYQKSPIKIKHTLTQSDQVIALSESWKYFFEHKVGLQNVSIIKNITPIPHPISNHSTSPKCHFLFLGYIDKKKGIYDLIESIIENKHILEDKILLHIGGNGEVDKLKQIISENKLEDIVKYEGWVSGLKKNELLSIADVYILPSYLEGLPISILEAMSYKLPIISTPVGGIPEVIENNINGILVEPGNKNQLSDAVIKLTYDIPMRKKMGVQSFNKVQDHLPENVEKQLHNIYQQTSISN